MSKITNKELVRLFLVEGWSTLGLCQQYGVSRFRVDRALRAALKNIGGKA